MERCAREVSITSKGASVKPPLQGILQRWTTLEAQSIDSPDYS